MKRFLALIALLWGVLGSPLALSQTTSDAGLAGLSTSVSLTADDQAVSAAGVGVILLSSDDATSTNRTFTLTASAIVGHRVILIWNHATNAGEIADTGIQKLSATWTPGQYDTLTLVSDGTNWIEVGRVNN